MLYLRSPTFVKSGILSGIVLIFDLNRDIVGSVRICGSNSFHSFKVDGKEEFSYEQSLENGISISLLLLRL